MTARAPGCETRAARPQHYLGVRRISLIIGSSLGLIPQGEVSGAKAAIVPIRCADLGQIVRSTAARAGFKQLDYSSRSDHGSYTGRKRIELTYVQSQDEATLLTRWQARDRGHTLVEWVSYAQSAGAPPLPDDVATMAFGDGLAHEAQAYLDRPRPKPVPVDPLVAPGGRPPESYKGQLYDYSPLAPLEALQALTTGTLPLGRSAFGWRGAVRYGPELFLRGDGGAPAEELGVMLCAPQGTGKTHLLLRWAAWAASAGRSVFIVDVKGNMRPELERALRRHRASAEILEFSTAVDAVSDRMNPLAGIDAGQVDCVEQLARLANALLPADSYEGKGEEELRHRIAARVLRGALQLLKLLERSGQIDGGRPLDLSDAYTLVKSEQTTMRYVAFVREREAWLARNGRRAASYSVEDCVDAMAIALGHEWRDESGERIGPFRGGRRKADLDYLHYTIPLIEALEPFRPGGYMAPRIRGFGPGREIRLDRFGRDGRSAIVLLSAREEEEDLAASILGISMRLLRNALDRRRTMAPSETGDVLLLLDETRRIPGFDAPEFVSIVRQNRVGYVLVYQGLQYIGDTDATSKLMRNIGTQVFLGGLTGDDLDYVNRHNPGRTRLRRLRSGQTQTGGGEPAGGYSEHPSEVPFLEANAAERLAAGRYPALVALRGGPRPFLVDLDEAAPARPAHG